MTPAEIEERARLSSCLETIDNNLHAITARLSSYASEIRTSKSHMWDARRDMDHLEKIAVRQTIEQKTRSGEVLQALQQKLLKLRQSPYFGRFDFAREDRGVTQAQPIYVGVHDFRDEASGKTFVYDWRAPISSLFYDFEIGPAQYQAPAGEVRGQLTLKRQFRIRHGRMDFMLETGVNIVDDVLQEELSRASDEGMKNIVATIQRDQNAIIRNAEAHTLIIQGVAGSGKTSIALHRIAFLLYRFKDTLRSEDILIISPNRVFSDYIGNVLPELGEERVSEIGMESLAEELLDSKVRFQTFFEQVTALLETGDASMKARIAAKASIDFLTQIDAYIDHLEAGSFSAAEWRTGRCIVPEWFFVETWRKHRGLPHSERVKHVVDAAEHKMGIYYNYNLRTDERRALRDAVRNMAKRVTLKVAYEKLFEWMGKPELFKPIGSKLEYADVFPLIHLKMRLEGIDNPRNEVKHLLIDEMQDYTPVQYAVLGKLFACRKTVLGDATQSINPFGASNVDQIQRALRASIRVNLTRSYRSTWEIMQFALHISPNDALIPMKRHGEPPQILQCRKESEVIKRILAEVRAFEGSPHQSLAIIVKTQKQAAKLRQQMAEAGVAAGFLTGTSTGFSTGVVVCSAHLAKGLEFDRVIIPDASGQNYCTEMDRNLLYVACTRAMHRLTLISLGEPATFLPSGSNAQPNQAATWSAQLD